MRILSVVAVATACSAPAAQPTLPAPAVAPPASAAAVTVPTERGLEPPPPALRLPRNFVPSGYQVRLVIDPAQTGFDGSIQIAGEVAQRSSVIWLHGHRFAVGRAVAMQGSATVALTATPRDTDLLELRAAMPLAPGAWTLALDYTGVFDQVNTSGIFKQTVAGAPYVYTQLEATYARRVFPCVDEPDSKVPWQLTLDVPEPMVAVSNTPIARQQALAGGRKRVEFAVTRPLPSYLVAFGVGPFDIVDAGKTRSGTPVRIIAMQGRAPETAWAAKTTVPLTELLEDFFGSPYPYEKLDMLAIPVTVGFGAMENAGLITFTETLILLDPKHAAKQREYEWIYIAAHELAHQWFGDLVTTAWWDDIWLNEGFANWVERKISRRFAPEWHEELSEIRMKSEALGADALVSARQIRQPIDGPDDIENAFDGITYDKGASVLNMFEGYLGEETFLRGVRHYLKKHAWGNATSREFTDAISEVAGKDVSAAFASFLEQPGAPEISATLACDAGAPPRVTLSQQRYVPPGAAVPASGKPWIVPVCIAYDRGGKRAEVCSLLDAETASIELDAGSCPRWMMPNASGRGYYRNAYTVAQVTMLRDEAWGQLKPTERWVVVYDTTNAAFVGKLPLALALSFVPRLLTAGDRFSIEAALAIPKRVRNFVPAELRPSYAAWLRRTFGPAARRAGFLSRDGDGLDIELVRAELIAAVADVGRDPALGAEAVKLAERWRDLPQATRRLVISLAARTSPAVFARMLKDVRGEPDRTRRTEMIAALAGVSDLPQQQQALGLMLDPGVDIRDTQFMLFGAVEEANRAAAQQFFRDHQEAILRRIPTDGTTGGQTWLAYAFTESCSAPKRDEIAEYVTRVFGKLPGGVRVVKQAIERMDQCIAQRALLEPEVRGWLEGGGVSPAGRAAK